MSGPEECPECGERLEHIYKPISSVVDLARAVTEGLGEHGSDDLAEIVVDYLLAQEDRPDWGADWAGWLCCIDLWAIAESESEAEEERCE